MNKYQPIAAESFQASCKQSPLSPLVRLGPIDDLETALEDSWYNVSQATYRFLVLLREFEMRQGWQAYGCNDCAEWMDFKLKISRKTALEKVRVAKAMWFVPEIDAAFKQGKLSYSQVRALTRVANQENEADLLERALSSTACNLERYCQRLRLGDESISQGEAKRQLRNRTLHLAVDDGALSAQLPPAELAIVQQALELLVAELPEDPERDFFAARADALVAMARQVIEGEARVGEAPADQADSPQQPLPRNAHQVLVHVDVSALNGDGGESDCPLPTVKRLCCSGEIRPIYKEGENVLDVGRKQRVVSNKLRHALVARDRQCQFPGCHHTRFLDAHHIKHWCDGGETSLENLVLLCTHHHTLMHEGGFGLRPVQGAGVEQYCFTRPDGRMIEGKLEASSAEDGDGLFGGRSEV